MNFLVLGSEGQLGRAIACCRLFMDHSVFLYDKDKLDITDRNALFSFFSSNSIDAVINCAAFTNVDLCEKMKDEAHSINVCGTRNIAEAALQHNAAMLHISTDFVFDGEKSSPYSEEDPTDPLNYYGVTKLMSEEIVRETVPKHFIVRTSSMYSRNGSNFVKAVLKKALADGEIAVVDDQVSCPTNADDLAEALFKLLMTEKFGTYHITDMGYCSKFEFAGFIVNYCGLSARVIPCSSSDFKDSAVRPRFSALDGSRFSRASGEEMPLWQDSVKRFLDENKDLYERK